MHETSRRAASNPPQNLVQGFHEPRISQTTTLTTTTSLWAETQTENEKDDQISEMDARVLQSMLRDNKLDLEQEYNMKKLLERGIRKDEASDEEGEDSESSAKTASADGEEAYSSQVIKTLADTKFWKAFKRNAGEVMESVGIAITNEIEKGAKVLVGLGFFAWDRAKRDVSRALPNAATVPPKKVFRLGETSSYVEPKAATDDETMTPSERARSIRQEFTTPADELSAVTAEISKIFQRADRQVAEQSQVDKSKDTRNPFFAAFVEEREFQQQKFGAGDSGATPFYASASLSTTAERGSGRLDKAFERAKKTTLAREKENLAIKGNRLVSGAVDSAYQIKTEISSEENVPGYKTKELRESTVDVSRRIAGAAKRTAGFLGGASNLLLGGGRKREERELPPALPDVRAPAPQNTAVEADPVEFLDDSAYFAFKREEPPPGQPQQQQPVVTDTDLSGGVVIEDNKVIDTDQPETDGGGAFGFLNAFGKRGTGQPEAATTGRDAISAEAPQAPPPQEMEIITDAEVVMDNKDNFNYYADADVGSSRSSSKDYFTTTSYLDDMDASKQGPTSTSTNAAATSVIGDDGLRQVTAEVISDDDFDETAFAQATTVDNLSAEELLRQQAAEEAEENAEPNFLTKATLRTLDVAFVVVEKGVSVAPAALELGKRAVTRATEAKLRDSAGSQIGWEPLNGNIRGDQRY